MPPDFAYRELGRELARRIDATERGYRAVCDEIGIAPAAVSRLRAGQPVAAHTVLAVCDWLQGSIYAWRMYEHPGDCSTGNAVKQVENQQDEYFETLRIELRKERDERFFKAMSGKGVADEH